ncbi:S-adenosyl-L-methionine-dependent methyltransferase, partial [Thamnocephalis sphaerospora]
PVENPTSALDVGCGTGIWMMEMATEFADCEFTGIDQITAQPDDVLPRNCQFVPCDQLTGGLPFGDASFDYVHQRMLVGSVPTGEWGGVCDELFRVTRPSGWTEIVDTDGLIHGYCPPDGDYHKGHSLGLCSDSGIVTESELSLCLGPAAARINRWMLAAMECRGVQPEEAFELQPVLQKSGFADVQSRCVAIPMGTWGGQAGQMCLNIMRSAIVSLRSFLLQEQITDSVEFAETLRDWELEADRGCYHMEVAVYWAQRPF